MLCDLCCLGKDVRGLRAIFVLADMSSSMAAGAVVLVPATEDLVRTRGQEKLTLSSL